MVNLSFKKSEFSYEYKRILKDTVITETVPGTILRDFSVILNYLKEKDLPVSGTHQFPRSLLPEINALLSCPIQLGLKRPDQKSYPHIDGLYLLLRASGLTCIEGRGKKLFLLVDKGISQIWESLNPTEKYFTSLETWLLRGKEEIIGRRNRSLIPDNFIGWIHFFEFLPKTGLQVMGDKGIEHSIRYIPGWYNLGLLELFGLIAIKPASPIEGEGWRIERIDRTLFGDALFALLYKKLSHYEKSLVLEKDERATVGRLQPLLQPYFPEWEKSLSIPERVFREGTYIFKISLGQVWFRIAIPAGYSLGSLSSIILDTVKFNYDHLYQFEYENPFGAFERVNHPYMDEGPWADDVLIGNLPLRIGQKMTYLYDFGDNWEFEVTLEKIALDRKIEKQILLEQHGKPPKQYRDWD
jgi:hypothetical protein